MKKFVTGTRVEHRIGKKMVGECTRWLKIAVLAVGGLLTGTGVLHLHNSLKGPDMEAGMAKNR